MTRFVVVYWVALLTVVCVSYAGLKAWQHYGSSPGDPGAVLHVEAPVIDESDREPLEHFTLTASNGRPFDSRALEGKVWVGGFFFTACPSSCWKMSQSMAILQDEVQEADLHFVSITCDPQNDTPEALQKYAAAFKADPERWHFLTGDMELIQDIGTDIFQLSVLPKTHSEKVTLVDRQGKIRGRYNATDPAQMALLKRVVADMLAEPVEAGVAEAEDTPGDAAMPEAAANSHEAETAPPAVEQAG